MWLVRWLVGSEKSVRQAQLLERSDVNGSRLQHQLVHAIQSNHATYQRQGEEV